MHIRGDIRFAPAMSSALDIISRVVQHHIAPHPMQPMRETTEAWVLVSGRASREGRIADRVARAYGHDGLTLGALWSACLPAWKGRREVNQASRELDLILNSVEIAGLSI